MLKEVNTLNHIISQFRMQGDIKQITPYGSGHINDTFLVETTNEERPNYILQKINHHIFKDVPALMNNILRVTQHLQHKFNQRKTDQLAGQALTLVLSQSAKPYYQDEDGYFWRTYLFIKDTCFYDIVPNADTAFRGGRAFGLFQNLLADLPAPPLHETIPHFHNLDSRLENFKKALEIDRCQRAAEIKSLIGFINQRSDAMRTILTLGEQNKIPLRVTHNDTKFNNVLLSTKHDSECVIDLDTVMPGYLQYDFSDTVRTATNTAAEDEADLSKVHMDINLFTGFAKGFLSEAASSLNQYEVEQLSQSADLLPFLIGVRFLTDYLDGDRYFKTHFEHHNLQRAKAQFQLVRSIEAQKPQLKQIIEIIMHETRA